MSEVKCGRRGRFAPAVVLAIEFFVFIAVFDRY
jgi:hypothetical protein